MCDGFIHPCESIALAKGAGLEVKDGQEDTGETTVGKQRPTQSPEEWKSLGLCS